jgi:hypothetical protein
MRVHNAKQLRENIHGATEHDVAVVRLATISLEAKEQPKKSEHVNDELLLNAEHLEHPPLASAPVREYIFIFLRTSTSSPAN